jgi:SAM-dependent methyltransferase
VDAIHCEAVLEHLERPDDAVAEMWRVLRESGEVFAATPFLQAFHAYPNHFQNFTAVGHRRLFERAGFEVRAAGTCVGPTFALLDLAAVYLRAFVPTWFLSRTLWASARLLLVPARALDRRLERSTDAHVLASTVFAHLRKRERR